MKVRLWASVGLLCCAVVACSSDGNDELESNEGRDAGPRSDAGADIDGGADDEDAARRDAGTEADAESTVFDPAPSRTEPGKYTCDGCPDTDVDTFEIAAGSVTSYRFQGSVTEADGNGEFYIESEAGQAIAGAIPTDDSGSYEFTAPLFCGAQSVKMAWTNAAGQLVVVTRAVTTDCVDAALRVTLVWDELGRDFELHLIKEGGRINDNATDCTWTSCIPNGPDWGVVGDTSDNPTKDVDNTGTFGPENIYLVAPAAGTYTVMVEHWNSGGAPGADGSVTINVKGKPPVTVPIVDLAFGHVFSVGTLSWPSGEFTPVGTKYDCNANWSGGCRDAIP